MRFLAAHGGTLQWSRLLRRNFPFNWFLDAFSLSQRIKTLLPSAPASSLPAAARHPATPLPSRPPRSPRRGAGSAARIPPVSPEPTSLTPRAVHPPGESGREKSRAAVMWKKKKSHINQFAPPQLSPSDTRGSLYPPHWVPALVPPAEGVQGSPTAAGHRDGASSEPGSAKPTSEKSPSGAPRKSNATVSPAPQSVTDTHGPQRASSPDAPHRNQAAVPGHHRVAPASHPRVSENAGQVIAHSLLRPQGLGVRWLTGHPVPGWPSWGLPEWVPGLVRTSRRGSRRAGWPAWQRVPGSVREPEGISVCRGRQSHPCP